MISLLKAGIKIVVPAAYFFCIVPAVLADQNEEAVAERTPKTVEYNITIQVNVLRICAGGKLYDLIEAESAGSGLAIKPYVVDAVDLKGNQIACESNSGKDHSPSSPAS